MTRAVLRSSKRPSSFLLLSAPNSPIFCLVESLAHNIPPDIAAAQMTEVRRRIAQVESDEVALIPGEEALAHVRRLVASARAAN